VKPSLIDTDILSLFFKNHPHVTPCFHRYLSCYGTINFSILTYYEIISGLKHRDAHKQLTIFLNFASQSTIVPLTENAVNIAGDIYAELCQQGTPLDDIDILIAGIALANNLILITHNRKHFEKIHQLPIEDWSVSS
jgi:tRNA(fMet)-specific endonuclease VapC